MKRLSFKEKEFYIRNYYGENLITHIVNAFHKNNTKLHNLLNTWWSDENAANFCDSNEGILLINLLYKLVKDEQDNTQREEKTNSRVL